ncbi:MAG: 4-hydroxythreonine-4-phosphate dehydrogenase PdxA [Pseudomonadota bacterium]
MARSSLPLAMTMGDPAGVGPLITRQAWQAMRDQPGTCFYVIGPPELYARSGEIAVIDAPSDAAARFGDALPVVPLERMGLTFEPGHPEIAAAGLITQSIDVATSHVMAGRAGAVVTNPIAKALLYEAGFPHPGHTEFLAALCAGEGPPPRPVMMLVGGGLRVALATIHLPLRAAIDAIDEALLAETAKIVDAALKRDFAIAAPRLVFTGLNPHAGEDGRLGREEIEIINPAAAALRASGYAVADARPADTVFAEALEGRFDAVIAMTHDQGLIPVKTLDLWNGVNVTLGLPIIRTSPDHGTGYDTAARGEARADSLIAAVQLARECVANRFRASRAA